ncbi:guanine nucleotide-binding protein-like 3 [Dermatophagoides farinae]|uniref:Guanine nucleotide-binding protein-like 3 homolog n=1 Tax=Dermatophagoides farinae TaxID=6954 RepID=A0A9D4P1H0_DERFA|nr:guanine nucleotide-binding protein-like 3 [Dermatophagoides farinae]
MTKGFHKKPSKRIPAKRRYKIEKKVRDHNRKLKKKTTARNKRKDPGIPNSLPFKEQILNEIQEHKKIAEEIKQVQKMQMKKNRQAKLQESDEDKRKRDFEALLKNAEKRAADFENKTTVEEYLITENSISTSNTKSFYKDVQKVIEASDIIIQVVDARDPLGTRCFEIEEIISKDYPDKKIILLMNKCDLVPKNNLIKWLQYLRNYFITIPFKASTQNQKQNLSTSKVNILYSSDELMKSSKCLGVDFLMKILNNYCHNKNVKTSITIGIVGFPNVGKSSVINSLKRTYVCNVGPTPGLTRSMQMVSLDKKIKLIDSPGIVFAKNLDNQSSSSSSSSSILALRNAINIDKLSDPILPVQAILNRVNAIDLIRIYGLTEFNTVQEFLSLIAKRFGKIVKGGRLDLESSAKKVLHDWNCGKLKYYTIPPENMDSTIDVKFVNEISKEFDLNQMTYEQMMDENLQQFQNTPIDDTFAIKPLVTKIQMTTATDDVCMMEQQQTQTNPSTSRTAVTSSDDVEMKEVSGMQLNKNIRTQFKKVKKQRKKDAKLSNQLEQINLQEDYDFDDYF